MNHDDLSDRAKAVCAALFGMMVPGKGEVTFHLREGRPSDEAQAGLDELVRADVISVEAFNQYGGLVYRPLIDCRWAHRWLGRNLKNPAAAIRMTVPLTGDDEARAHQRRALSAKQAATPARVHSADCISFSIACPGPCDCGMTEIANG